MWITKEQLIEMYEGNSKVGVEVVQAYRGEDVIAALVTEQNFQAAQSELGEGDVCTQS